MSDGRRVFSRTKILTFEKEHIADVLTFEIEDIEDALTFTQLKVDKEG